MTKQDDEFWLQKIYGDQFLSSMDRQLWQIQQRVIFDFGCYTIFKWTRLNVPEKTKGFIEWFVPKQHDSAFEISKWLQHELGQFERPDFESKELFMPGTEIAVLILEFSGIEWYVDRDTSHKLTMEVIEKLKTQWGEKNTKK